MFVPITVKAGNSMNDTAFAGRKKIAGAVSERRIPLPCIVNLFERQSGVVVRRAISDAEGVYAFENLNSQHKYYVLAHHPASTYNAVIQDNVVPK